EPFKMLLLTNFWNSFQIRNRACVPCALIQFLFQLFVERFRYRIFRLSSGFAAEYIPSESHKLINISSGIWTSQWRAIETKISVRNHLHVVVHLCARSDRGCWTRNIKCKCVPLDTKIRPGFKSQPDDLDKWHTERYFWRSIDSKRHFQ